MNFQECQDNSLTSNFSLSSIAAIKKGKRRQEGKKGDRPFWPKAGNEKSGPSDRKFRVFQNVIR
jgi:hypothetical protein